MKRTRFSEEQIIAVLHEGAGAVPIRDVCRKHGITEQTSIAGEAGMAAFS
jgi:putative transposase